MTPSIVVRPIPLGNPVAMKDESQRDGVVRFDTRFDCMALSVQKRHDYSKNSP